MLKIATRWIYWYVRGAALRSPVTGLFACVARVAAAARRCAARHAV
jgi:hypothetical protein